jgi:hypothetical protein
MKKQSQIREINLLEPREEVVSHLERLLEEAKSGELIGIFEVVVFQGGFVNSGWAMRSPENLRTMIGELEMLKRDLIRNYMQDD